MKFQAVIAAIRNKLAALTTSIAAAVDNTAYNEATWNGVTTIAPSKNAVRDELETIKTSITSAVNTVIDSAPGALDTLNELAAALGDDAAFATTVTNALAAKADGAASSTDEAIARFDGTTGKVLQNSAATVSDTGVINIPENVSLQMGSQRAMEMQATALLIGTIAVNRPVYFYMGSVNVLRLMTSSGNMNSGPYQHTFGSAIGNQDVGIGRVAAGELKVTDGSTGLGKIIVGGSTPASASATGTQGTITWDADYIYICTATNTWKRVAIATW